MLSTAIIIFREILEIAIILGILLAATRGVKGRTPWILGGLAAGALGASLVAVFAQSIASSLSGSGQEIFNACILFAAASMIGWTLIWIRRHVREMTTHLRQVGQNVLEGKTPLYSLFVITSLALLREGSEIVMFTYGMLVSGQSLTSIATGCLLGGVLGALVGIMLYYGLLRMTARYMLSVTSWLLVLLVAGLVAQAVGYLSAAGYFGTLSYTLWDSSWLLSERSVVGNMLHILVGYTARPTAIQLICYLSTIAALFLLITRQDRPRMRQVTT